MLERVVTVASLGGRGLLHDLADGWRPAELFSLFGEPRSEVPDQATERVDGGALIDGSPELELFWSHETGRPKHPTHRVDAGSALIGVEVHQGELPRIEIDQEGPVVEVRGDPTASGELLMDVDDGVEMAQELRSGR